MLATAKKTVKRAVIKYLLWKERRPDAPDGEAFGGLAPGLWGCDWGDDGVLTIDGVSAKELVSHYGSPLHVLNEKKLAENYQGFLGAFEAEYPNVSLATSYKTNPVPHVLKCLHDLGSHAEVISHFELWLALKLGVPPERLILNGPGKGNAALELAVEKRVKLINVDGPGEIEKIAVAARRLGVRQKVGLRVITSVGWSSQFGLSLASGAAEAAYARMTEFPELEPAAIHLHLGTRIQSVQTYVQAVEEVIQFSEMLASKYGIQIDHFDLGGGFGVPTVRGIADWDVRMLSLGYPARFANPDSVPKPADYAKALAPLLNKLRHKTSDSVDCPAIVFEPGRAITSSSQVLLLSVMGKKQGVGGNDFLILDGGANLALPLEWETHQIFPATQMNATASRKCDVFGPLCHPGDVLCQNRQLPALEEGDVLAVMDSGAYFIPNQMNFSNPRPAVATVRNGQHQLVRRREEFTDIVRMDQSPGFDHGA